MPDSDAVICHTGRVMSGVSCSVRHAVEKILKTGL